MSLIHLFELGPEVSKVNSKSGIKELSNIFQVQTTQHLSPGTELCKGVQRKLLENPMVGAKSSMVAKVPQVYAQSAIKIPEACSSSLVKDTRTGLRENGTTTRLPKSTSMQTSEPCLCLHSMVYNSTQTSRSRKELFPDSW